MPWFTLLLLLAPVARVCANSFHVSARASAGAGTITQGEQEARGLELGKAIERELAGGGAHAYQLTLAAGQYLQVAVEQRGIDVAVMLFGPDGKPLFEFDRETRNQGLETVSQVAEVAGNYRLNIQSKQKEAVAGRYEIRVMELRAATEQDRTLQEARGLYTASLRLYRAGKYDEARPLAERALEMRGQALGPEHGDVAQSLNDLANIYLTKADYAKAEPLYQRALAIWEKALGQEHPVVAVALNNFALLYRNKGDFAKAELLHQRALAIREKALGPEHPDVAQSLNNLALIYWNKGDYARAEPLLQRALAIKEKTLGPKHLSVSSSLSNLANLYTTKGDYAKAEPLYQRAMAIEEKGLGPDHPEVARSLNNLASLYSAKADYAEAEPLYQRALTILEKALGPEHPNIAQLLDSLADVYRNKGDYAKAEPFHQRAMAILEKALGPQHPNIAHSFDSLALLYRDKGDYTKAELFHQRALAIREKALGLENLSVATSHHNLASLYHDKGDYTKAETLYQRALAIKEKLLGLEHRSVALSLNNLANLYRDKGDYTKGEPLYQRALAIWEKALGPEHPDVAHSLNNLATLYNAKGDLAKAEPLYQRSLAIWEQALGPEHPTVAMALSRFAGLYHAKGDYSKAELLHQRALTIREKALGTYHPAVADSLNGLAALHTAKGDLTQAVAFRSRASSIDERNIALNLATGSERQKLAYLATLSTQTDQTISLHVHAAPNDSAARSLAATIILQRKGRTLDAVTDTISALRRRFTAQDQTLLDQLNETSAQLARLVLGGPQKMTPAEYQKQITDIEEQKEKFEAEISSRSAEFRVQSLPVTVAAIQSAIPPDAALVELIAYRPFNAKYAKPDEAYGDPRYVAYVLRRQGEVQWVELGEAKAIDEAIADLRQALRDPQRTDVKRLARKVDERVMRPLRALLGETRRVLLSPDGALNLIPFAALVDEQNRYLVIRYSISYLTSGRDLLRLQLARESKGNPLVIADPAFGESASAEAPVDRGFGLLAASEQSGDLQSMLARARFQPLPGTAGEAQALKRILPQATVLVREQATEAALKQASSPRLLHIATHGFFLKDAEAGVEGARGLGLLNEDAARLPSAARGENPLLRSGLLLAGANQRRSGNEDGVLTALEVAGLDLWGTKLVVLSACNTGVGEVKNGEGVYGLRRALVLAGAESQVMSLWSVSDQSTRDLMIAYYQALQRGEERGEALRQVQLRMLRSKERRHPYYWASFIQSGEWKALNGKETNSRR